MISENGRQGEGRAGSAACPWGVGGSKGIFPHGMLPILGRDSSKNSLHVEGRPVYLWR